MKTIHEGEQDATTQALVAAALKWLDDAPHATWGLVDDCKAYRAAHPEA